jgi:hypothetical protein
MGSLTQSSSPGGAAGWSDLPKEEVLAELERLLTSQQFRTSKKCSRFLRHIVHAALDGRFERLKERTLGIEVFQREPHYDTNQDPIVRGTAGEVRKRLAQHYLESGGGPFRITLPSGSYVPEVHYVLPERLQPVMGALVRPQPRNTSRSGLLAGAATILCAALTGLIWLVMRPTSLDQFWAPVANGRNVLVCMGQPQVYTFWADTARAVNSLFETEAENRKLKTLPAAVPLKEIVPLWDISATLADTQAFSRLSSFFAGKKARVDLRGERSVSLSDLRAKPAVFIGAFDNHWTLNLASDLRFYFDTDKERHAQMIRDQWKPFFTGWELVDAWPPGSDIHEDFALVARMVNRTTEQSTVIIGGIAQYGTDAAAELVTDPGYFERGLVHAPRDWYRKNMEVVLSTKVLSGVGGPPTVVAAYFW